MKNLLLITIYLIISQSIFSQKHWESIILAGDTWSYLPAVSEPPTTWNQPAFDDSAWKTGAGGFGYADGDDATVTSASNSIYLRQKFTIANTSIVQQLLLDIDYDDAFVLYLNGLEVARSGNITANPPAFNSALTVDHEALLYRGFTPERFELKASYLKQGENTLAIQILNKDLTSSDMSALVFLNALINNTAVIYHQVPTWFAEPVSTVDSNLPLIIINTQGVGINDVNKISARMSVINNANGVNNINDTAFEYDGFIGIKIRGSSSEMFPKKNYNIETRTDLGANLNFPLLGLPAENDWVFHGPYTDKSLMRNVLAYHMGNLTGRWSPRTRFCEMYINKEYLGVYALVEKIKIDSNRVSIASLKLDEIAGDALTGGYLLKIDRPDEGAWISPYKARNDIQAVPISYVDPEYANLQPEQRTYIKDYVTAFENALRGVNYKDPVVGYRAYVNMQSFVDYYIVNEISRNLDGYRLSTYFYKEKDSKGGKLTMGPFWDYDLTFGNANFFSAGNTAGWVVDGLGNGDEYGIPFWWEKLRTDPYFEGQLKNRWVELRRDKFSNDNLNYFIDSSARELATAQQRNFQKFNILNTNIWPNNYVGGTYANEITYMKTWLNNRLAWIDSKMNLISALDETVSLFTGSINVNTYPNPFTESITLQFKLPAHGRVNIGIDNILGKTICNLSKECREGNNEFTFNAQEFNGGAGLYIYKISVDGVLVSSGKIIKK